MPPLYHGVMLNCDIKGCKESASELLQPEYAKRFLTVTAEQWPNLDWWAMGGVDKITLCPQHRKVVHDQVVLQRTLDPSMNQERPNPGNRH